MKKPLINWLGLLGIISLLSYSAAVLVTPLAYPGYNWMEQAVSDLSATKAPSLMLWNQLASLYNLCGLISIMMVCVYPEKAKQNDTTRNILICHDELGICCWLFNLSAYNK